jgi:hypothetical protein
MDSTRVIPVTWFNRCLRSLGRVPGSVLRSEFHQAHLRHTGQERGNRQLATLPVSPVARWRVGVAGKNPPGQSLNATNSRYISAVLPLEPPLIHVSTGCQIGCQVSHSNDRVPCLAGKPRLTFPSVLSSVAPLPRLVSEEGPLGSARVDRKAGLQLEPAPGVNAPRTDDRHSLGPRASVRSRVSFITHLHGRHQRFSGRTGGSVRHDLVCRGGPGEGEKKAPLKTCRHFASARRWLSGRSPRTTGSVP